MLIKTILNNSTKLKSFVFEAVRFSEDKSFIEVMIRARKNGKAHCGGCQKCCAVYDASKSVRRFEFIPILNYKVFFLYAVRRVACPSCGIKTEAMPWSDGKKPLTTYLMKYLADWCRHLSWQEVSRRYGVSWHQVYSAVEWVVSYGLKHRVLEGALLNWLACCGLYSSFLLL